MSSLSNKSPKYATDIYYLIFKLIFEGDIKEIVVSVDGGYRLIKFFSCLYLKLIDVQNFKSIFFSCF